MPTPKYTPTCKYQDRTGKLYDAVPVGFRMDGTLPPMPEPQKDAATGKLLPKPDVAGRIGVGDIEGAAGADYRGLHGRAVQLTDDFQQGEAESKLVPIVEAFTYSITHAETGQKKQIPCLDLMVQIGTNKSGEKWQLVRFVPHHSAVMQTHFVKHKPCWHPMPKAAEPVPAKPAKSIEKPTK